jgi:hypothetical protein
MRTFGLAPFWRSTIGFDRLFELIDESRRISISTGNAHPKIEHERAAWSQGNLLQRAIAA